MLSIEGSLEVTRPASGNGLAGVPGDAMMPMLNPPENVAVATTYGLTAMHTVNKAINNIIERMNTLLNDVCLLSFSDTHTTVPARPLADMGVINGHMNSEPSIFWDLNGLCDVSPTPSGIAPRLEEARSEM